MNSTGFNLKDSSEILTKDGWKLIEPQMPYNVEKHCMVVFNSTTVMLIGGETSKSYYSRTTYFYNFETNHWSQGPNLRIGRIEHACGMVRTDKDSEEVEAIRLLLFIELRRFICNLS